MINGLLLKFKLIQHHSHKSQQLEQPDAYWSSITRVYSQLQGLVDGQNAGAGVSGTKMTRLQVILINLDGDLFDLIPAFIPTSEQRTKKGVLGHCTSFIRVTFYFTTHHNS